MIDISAQVVTGTAAGVPFLAAPPTTAHADAPVVIAWHLMDPPRTEAAFAAALPLAGLDAWRISLGLPMCGARTPPGGPAELMRLGFEDAVLNLQGPVAAQGVAEFPAAFAALRDRLGFGDGPVAFVGGSMGSAVAQLAALSTDAPDPAAMVLISPISRLRAAVDGIGRHYGVEYPWGGAALAVADRLDFVSRAAETAARRPAVRIIVGALDDAEGFRAPAQQLRDSLAAHHPDPAHVDLVTVEGMAHELAEEPGVEPAPQLPQAAEVDRLTVAWLRAHLVTGAVPVALVHGNPETAAVWDPLVAALRERGVPEVLRLSPPGFGAPVPLDWGATMTEYRQWLVDELGTLGRPVHLVGHDWGGVHVLGVAMTRPDLLVSWSSDVLGLLDPGYAWHGLARTWQTPGEGEAAVAAMTRGTVAERAAHLESMRVPAGIAAQLAPGCDPRLGECVLRLYRSAAQPALAELGQGLPAAAARPGLALLAEADGAVGTPEQRRRSAARAGAEVAALAGAGHWWMHEAPEPAADALTRFWSAIEAQPTRSGVGNGGGSAALPTVAT